MIVEFWGCEAAAVRDEEAPVCGVGDDADVDLDEGAVSRLHELSQILRGVPHGDEVLSLEGLKGGRDKALVHDDRGDAVQGKNDGAEKRPASLRMGLHSQAEQIAECRGEEGKKRKQIASGRFESWRSQVVER